MTPGDDSRCCWRPRCRRAVSSKRQGRRVGFSGAGVSATTVFVPSGVPEISAQCRKRFPRAHRSSFQATCYFSRPEHAGSRGQSRDVRALRHAWRGAGAVAISARQTRPLRDGTASRLPPALPTEVVPIPGGSGLGVVVRGLGGVHMVSVVLGEAVGGLRWWTLSTTTASRLRRLLRTGNESCRHAGPVLMRILSLAIICSRTIEPGGMGVHQLGGPTA